MLQTDYLPMCVCVRERESETDRDRQIIRDNGIDRSSLNVCVCVCAIQSSEEMVQTDHLSMIQTDHVSMHPMATI